MLPPSPRWLVLKGRREAAARSLGKLRLRKAEDVDSDPLVQVLALRSFFAFRRLTFNHID